MKHCKNCVHSDACKSSEDSGYFDAEYCDDYRQRMIESWFETFLDVLETFGVIIILLPIVLLTMITLPIWIVPYLVKRRRNDNDRK